VSGHVAIVYSGTVAMVRWVRVPSGCGMVIMGTCGVTMLHLWVVGKPELSPLLEAV
jgi:hypothetical protein